MATRNPAYRFASPITFSALSLPDSPQRTAIPAVTYLVVMFAVVIQGSSTGNLIARFN